MFSASINLAENSGVLELFTDNPDDNSLVEVDVSEAEKNGEAPVQIMEGRAYEYQLPDGLELEPRPRIIKSSKRAERQGRSEGRITPGIYVGTLSLNVLDKVTGQKKDTVRIEVRSVKTSYRDDYRFMLEEIAEQCTDLLMQHSSPVSQTFTTDYDSDPATMYQRFAFVKSILESDEFQESVHRVISSPVTAWAETDADVDIRRVRRLKSSHLRQIGSRSNRVNLPDDHPLYPALKSVPARITVDGKTETVDTPENRFVKHALETFLNFCTEVRKSLYRENGNMSRAYAEANALAAQMEDTLNHDFFKSISQPQSLPLNSPVLQRKEGYREVLRGWLMFDLAARLVWQGGEDVYSAGKRDVAVLYEYWLFFKLLEIISNLFSIDPESAAELIESTGDRLGLKLKSGKHIPLKGVYAHPSRKMNVEFSYNRTFSGQRPYPESGSWSKQMRPDYTLTLWPSGFTQQEAERQELIVHVHFDAKYRVEGISQIFGNAEPGGADEEGLLNNEKEEERRGTYKRADLLKMHAYKDAIRRTAGAYVLYPGNDNSATMKGFHEIIPGLGAFAVRPSRVDDGTAQLKIFITGVVDHLLNRASQRDRMTYQTFRIHEGNPDDLREPMPETNADCMRSKPPAEVSVLIGYIKDDRHFAWVDGNGLYNFRVDSARGSIRLSSEAAGATYILLHEKGKLETDNIWLVKGKGPRIFSRAEMDRRHYPSPGSQNYLVYEIEKCPDDSFGGIKWDVKNIPGYSTGRSSAMPFAVTLAELMKAKIQ